MAARAGSIDTDFARRMKPDCEFPPGLWPTLVNETGVAAGWHMAVRPSAIDLVPFLNRGAFLLGGNDAPPDNGLVLFNLIVSEPDPKA